jgi:hypothetical protein
MADPFEDGGIYSFLQLASVVDATFDGHPDDDVASVAQSRDPGVAWAAWVRDMLVFAIENVEKRQRRQGLRPDSPLWRRPVDPGAVAAAKAALDPLAHAIGRGPISRNVRECEVYLSRSVLAAWRVPLLHR